MSAEANSGPAWQWHARPGGDRHVVVLSGELDLAARDQLVQVLRDTVGQARLVEVDLDQVRFVDSSALSALLLAQQDAIKAGGRLIVTNARGQVRRVLDMTGLIAILTDS